MKKIFLTIAGLVMFSLAIGSPISVFAATVTYNAETTISLPNGVTVVILNGGLVESLVVKDDSSIVTTFGSDTNITLRSTTGNLFTVDGLIVNASGSGAVGVCKPGLYNEVQFTATSGTATTSFTTAISCPASSGGGGGGGGGGGVSTVVTPTNTSIAINGGNATTDSGSVTLTLAATDATTMLVANNSDFSDASSFEDYAVTKSWTFESGLGSKTVYVKFRSSSGGESSAISDTIEVVAVSAPTTSDVSGAAGGSVSLADGKAAVDFPAGAISGSGTLSITPTSSYTNPVGGKQVVGSRVYNITINSDGTDVTSFQDFVTLTFTYTDEEIAGLDETSLQIYFWDEATSSWVAFGGDVDVDNNTITRKTSHFTTFAILGTPGVSSSESSGQLVKLECGANPGVNDPCRAVYYVGNDGKRYVFPNEKTYNTWYSDFSSVTTVTAEALASYIIGGNATYRPGVKLVKIQTNAKVYAVDMNGSLRWVTSGEVAESLYGTNWSSMVEDIPDAFFVNYSTGSDIGSVNNYSPAIALAGSPDINTDKGL